MGKNLSIIDNMRQLPKKLLAVLLSVLLGLIPLQGALAGFTSPVEQKEEGQHHLPQAHHSSDMVSMHDHAAEMDCENCNSDSGCNGNDCSSEHCVCCFLVLLPYFFFPENLTLASVVIQADSDLVRFSSTALFRPPKA